MKNYNVESTSVRTKNDLCGINETFEHRPSTTCSGAVDMLLSEYHPNQPGLQ